jgi:hypothetical protein
MSKLSGSALALSRAMSMHVSLMSIQLELIILDANKLEVHRLSLEELSKK